MPTPVMPLRRIRIHKRRVVGGWFAYCPCCWFENGTGFYIGTDRTFDGACSWAALHIAAKHRKAT